jgi:hypothetical protein
MSPETAILLARAQEVMADSRRLREDGAQRRARTQERIERNKTGDPEIPGTAGRSTAPAHTTQDERQDAAAAPAG